MTTATHPALAASAVRSPVYLSADELALRWHKTLRTIQRMVSDGKIAPVRINRTPLFDLGDVEAYEQAMRGLQAVAPPVPAVEPAIQLAAPRRLRPRVPIMRVIGDHRALRARINLDM